MTEPTDAELDELRQANSGRLNFVTFSEFRTIARAVLAKWGTPQPVAPSEPTPAFDDPRVQAVYGILCDDADWPPKDEPQQHWEGWIARRIVERLCQEPVLREPLTDSQAQVGAVPLTCEWTHDENDGFWESACGEAWQFNDGGPADNNVRFCQGCGKPLGIKGGQHGTE